MEQHVNKILWIDDDINGYPLMPYLDEFDDRGIYEIVKAVNPDEMESELRKHYDLKCIIVDICMPLGEKIPFGEAKGGMQTGLVILKRLMGNPKLEGVKKVVFTMVESPEVREYCKAQNPEIPYLEKKTFNTSKKLVDKIERIIRQQQ
jgi:CheY-like chemotaxis protein